MKKLIIILAAITTIISGVQAALGDQETYVIKDNQTVRVFHIKDVTQKSYSWEEFQVTGENRTNISASDLQALEVPEGAWKLCSSNHSGIYSTKEVKLTAENKELEKANKELTAENKDLSSSLSTCHFQISGLIVLAGLLLGLLIVKSVKLKKERAR